MVIKILQWNANGVRPKTSELKNLIINRNYDVICIQETFLNEKLQYNLPGYIIERLDRKPNCKGGLLTAIKEGISYKIHKDNFHIECQHIEIISMEGNLHIKNVYMSPSEDYDKNQMQQLFNADREIVLGDFNAKHFLWNSQTENKRGKELADIINNLPNYIVLNTGQATHQNYQGGMSTIDITFATANVGNKCNWDRITLPLQ